MTDKQIDHFNIGHEKRAAVTRLSRKLFIIKTLFFVHRNPYGNKSPYPDSAC